MPLLSALPLLPVTSDPSSTTPRSGSELTTADGRSLPLLGAQLRGEARGGIARLVLEQTFENRHAETLDVTYRMPLPADGAVSGYAFVIGERTITGRVDKKQAAREQFERALAEGKTAALLEQDRADIFTQRIGNLPAGERLVARITIDQRLIWLPEGEWELRFPTVIGPRYVGAEDTSHDAAATAIAVAPGGIAARIGISLAIGDAIVPGRRPSSPSHRITGDRDVSLELGAALDRDIVVRWPVARREVGLALDVTRTADGKAYGLVTIVPPERAAGAPAVPRDLIVLLDTSGSMSGQPLDLAKRVVALMIDTLGEADRLELIEFSSTTRRYAREPLVATAKAKRDAIAWVRSRRADGGTEMSAAVREALRPLRAGAQRQVVLVTDGYIGGEQQIVRQLHDSLPRSCRLHVLGIGSAVNRSLATALARAGRGAEVLVAPGDDIERGAKRLLDRTRMPVLTELELSGSALVRHVPEHLPDVFEGAPVLAAVELAPGGGELVVRGELAREATGTGSPYRDAPAVVPWVQRVSVPAVDPSSAEANPAIAALFAREHVADLETRWTIGDHRAIDAEIERTGVAFQIATRLTSWIAIDHDRRVTGPVRHELVPQELPHGTTAASFGLRAPTAMPLGGAMAMLSPAQAAPGGMPMPSRAYAFVERSAGPEMEVADSAAFDQPTGTRMPVFAAPSAAPRRARSRWPMLVVLALVLVIAALVWWLVM
jgi:Ca-activated chloride channel homolog